MVFSSADHHLNPIPPYTFTNSQTTELGWNFVPTTSVVCYQDVFGSFYSGAQAEMLQMMQTVWTDENQYHTPLIGDNVNTFNAEIMGTWSYIISNGLQDGMYGGCRDFFWCGHGGPVALGGVKKKADGSDGTTAVLP